MIFVHYKHTASSSFFYKYTSYWILFCGSTALVVRHRTILYVILCVFGCSSIIAERHSQYTHLIILVADAVCVVTKKH